MLCLLWGVSVWAIQIEVVVQVGNETITDRQLSLFAALQNKGSLTPLDKKSESEMLEQMIVYKMVNEDNQFFQGIPVSDEEVRRALLQFKNQLGGRRLKALYKKLSSNESEIRAMIKEKLVFEKSLAEQESIELWLKQLRSRYPVTYFKRKQEIERLKKSRESTL